MIDRNHRVFFDDKRYCVRALTGKILLKSASRIGAEAFARKWNEIEPSPELAARVEPIYHRFLN